MNTSNLINWFIIYAYTINCASLIKESIQFHDTGGTNRVNLIQGKSLRFKKGEKRGMDCGSNSNGILPYKYYYMVPIIHSNVLSNPISVKYMISVYLIIYMYVDLFRETFLMYHFKQKSHEIWNIRRFFYVRWIFI